MSTTAIRSSPSTTLAAVTLPRTTTNSASPRPAMGNALPPTATPKNSTSSQSSTPHKEQGQHPSTRPGAWRHPRMDEVVRRQNATNFDKSNVYAITVNGILLLVSLGLHRALNWISLALSAFPRPPSIEAEWEEALRWAAFGFHYALIVLRVILVVNIGLALRPLLRTQDTCEDIPLTPSQRLLFGLPPLSRPATPKEKEQYITPPRYTRSASGTPRSSSSSLYAEVSGSPLDLSSRRASFTGTTPFRSPSGSPASGLQPPRAGSGERRKLSYTANRSSPLSISEFDAAGSVSTPTKTAGMRASVGLNNKWLYEKGKGNGNSWTTGSIFS